MLRRVRQNPEAAIQRQVVSHLRMYLPSEVWWTASMSGVSLSPQAASRAKALGMRKGFPDLSFIWPDGSTSYLELKAPKGRLTPEQAALAKTLADRMDVCTSLVAVVRVLDLWMAAHGLRWLTDTEAYRRSTCP